MHLHSVNILDAQTLSSIISGCPIFEYLRIQCCMPNLRKLNISSRTLKGLCLIYMTRGRSTPPLHKYILHIETPALEYLEVSDYLPERIEYGDFEFLFAVNIEYKYMFKDDCDTL